MSDNTNDIPRDAMWYPGEHRMAGELPADTITAEAVELAAQGIRKSGVLSIRMQESDAPPKLALAALAAALPALTAPAAAHAAADERERIRQLAIDKGATYVESHSWPGGGTFCNSPFADLLGGAADGAHTPGGTT